jgi:hypothetical protein
MQTKNIFFAALFIFALVSCEKNVTIDIPRKDPKLVVHSVLESDQPLSVSIGKTRHILDPGVNGQQDAYIVSNALPVVWENGIAIDTLVYDPVDRIYKTVHQTVIRQGFDYALRISAPGYKDAEAFTKVPDFLSIASITRVHDARIDAYGEHQDEIRIRFSDPPGKDFYQLQVLRSYGPGTYPVGCVQTTDKDVEATGYSDPIAGDDCLDAGNLLLRDDNFNGAEKTIILYVYSSDLMEYPDAAGNIHRPYIRLNRITEDHFRYIKSYALYENASDNPFAEPVNVYTNVKNGYGIFAGYAAAVDTVR